jgi:hypothetical protein
MNPNNAATPLRVATGSEVYSSAMAAPQNFLTLRKLDSAFPLRSRIFRAARAPEKVIVIF